MKRKSLMMLLVSLLVLMGIVMMAQAQSSAASPYRIVYFTADRTVIEPGGCVTLSYWVVGARLVALYGSNWTTGPEIIRDNPNQRVVCPSAAGGYVPGAPVTYTLGALLLNGQIDHRSVTIITDRPSGTATRTPVPPYVASPTPPPAPTRAGA